MQEVMSQKYIYAGLRIVTDMISNVTNISPWRKEILVQLRIGDQISLRFRL